MCVYGLPTVCLLKITDGTKLDKDIERVGFLCCFKNTNCIIFGDNNLVLYVQ